MKGVTSVIEVFDSPIDCTVVVPGSKSIANRALVCAAFAGEGTTVANVPDGDDSVAMVHGLRALGVDIEAVREKLHVRDADGRVQVGADAFGALWSRTRGLRWLARLLAFPRVRAFAQYAYDVFARRLYRWNRRHGRW